jgi:hypothetical protein
MKYILLLALVASTSLVSAQKMRINAYTLYVFDDKYDSYYDSYNYYQGTINGGFMGGLGLEFLVRPDYSVELLWLHQSTKSPTTYQEGVGNQVKNTDFDLNLDYIMIGAGRLIRPPDGKVEAYGGLYAGIGIAGIKNPDNGNTGSGSKFAWSARLGCNIWATERFGIKLQAQILSISQAVGGGLYFGTGGAGAGVSSYSSIYQFALGGGLTLKLGH